MAGELRAWGGEEGFAPKAWAHMQVHQLLPEEQLPSTAPLFLTSCSLLHLSLSLTELHRSLRLTVRALPQANCVIMGKSLKRLRTSAFSEFAAGQAQGARPPALCSEVYLP